MEGSDGTTLEDGAGRKATKGEELIGDTREKLLYEDNEAAGAVWPRTIRRRAPCWMGAQK